MEGIRGIQHPLQTPVVLDCIFKNLDLNDLKECRQVCKTWRQESGKTMRALAIVDIQCHQSNQQRGPSIFLELVNSNESTFFQAPFAEKFRVVWGEADNPEFWETCGSYFKTLKLDRATFSSADTFRHAIFECCPNLQKLELDNVEMFGESAPEPEEWVPPQFTPNRNLKSLSLWDIRNGVSMGWLEILGQFPCLESLMVCEMYHQTEIVFRALEVARQHDSSCWKLKEVELKSYGLTTIMIPAFARVFGKEGGLTLTSLSIIGIADNTKEDVTAIQKILVAHSHSLKKLDIDLKSNAFPEADVFPLPGNLVFENVLELNLFKLNFQSTRLLQAFPNVKKLMLFVHEVPEDTETPHVKLENCEQLILNSQIGSIDEFKRLFELLPNLRKFKTFCLDNERFSLICEHWTDLTHLELPEDCDYDDDTCMEIDDVGISGYDRKDVRKINKKGRRGSWRPITVRRANLSSLKNLQSFFLKLSFDQFPKVGYCSQACGILELPNLKHLRVERAVGDGVEDDFGKPEYVPMLGSLSEQFPWNDSQKISAD